MCKRVENNLEQVDPYSVYDYQYDIYGYNYDFDAYLSPYPYEKKRFSEKKLG